MKAMQENSIQPLVLSAEFSFPEYAAGPDRTHKASIEESERMII